jgi:hypothetical protein
MPSAAAQHFDPQYRFLVIDFPAAGYATFPGFSQTSFQRCRRSCCGADRLLARGGDDIARGRGGSRPQYSWKGKLHFAVLWGQEVTVNTGMDGAGMAKLINLRNTVCTGISCNRINPIISCLNQSINQSIPVYQ